ncbi:peroxidase family protein [Alteromonas sp. C1M14]|uniref:peroxidase family protein n=1 Tax=Alteromonas sp. C1M14 TaxID=2841567 RepID=UPI001C080CA8|nr:peroxidase family protein [Alteromonas sp. C1M14]MBU2977708.1 hypothetical protein [Alteromonas sp. C1M14]
MDVEDKDYLFGKSTCRPPSSEEIAQMVEGIIPWSDPIADDTEGSFDTDALALLRQNVAAPVTAASPSVGVKPMIPLNGKLPAGYTYWGQWIAHDIVEPTHPNQNHYSSRKVTPCLNLDSLYGVEKGLPSHIYVDERGFFRLPDNSWDCLRDSHQTPLLPEPRNNDNAIILQFHVQWQRIHNNILNTLSTQPLPHLWDDGRYFYQARRLTTQLFHHLVKQEWLKALLDKSVYQYYFASTEPKQRLIHFTDQLARVPLEFSHGAFRFGHSMVRETYKLTASDSFNLHALLTHQPFNGKPIGGIDWSLFFGDYAQEIQPINLIVVAGMGKVPVNRNIAERNILAGKKVALATVHECKRYLMDNYPWLCQQTGLTVKESNQVLEELKIDPMSQTSTFYRLYEDNRLPLWPYVLAEASAQVDNPGHRLGKLGSIIVAEVLAYAMHKGVENNDKNTGAVDSDVDLAVTCRTLKLPEPQVLTMADMLCQGAENG